MAVIHVADFVNLCLRQRGDVYIYGVEVSPSNPDPGAFDCSELLQWAGARLGVSPPIPDGSWAQYDHCKRNGLAIPVDQGIRTYGALLFRGTPSSPARDHVACSLGDGNTIEARGRAYGVNVFGATGREWNAAGLIPGLVYDGSKYPVPTTTISEEDDDVAVFITTDNEGVFVTDGLTKRWVRGDDDRAGLRNVQVVKSDTVFGLPVAAFDAIPTIGGGGAPTGRTKGQ